MPDHPHAEDATTHAPDSPLSKLATAAVALHELYTSYVTAGFTKAEALELVKAMISKKP
ncbi:hypothetical protein OG264_16030 [Streptomyces xanthophaeus]|uniref:hypothetical protein n=1 Tax=Streptomyces xanthophaeus TaxID=67385 RepID=UPI0038690974|nr:hypothetical protein OG264_16030 [Streptomyces xanthophaeus]WST62157.1 hypothetical protein OG605_22405 [Streptomyces xanthophaeus]